MLQDIHFHLITIDIKSCNLVCLNMSIVLLIIRINTFDLNYDVRILNNILKKSRAFHKRLNSSFAPYS